MKTLINNILDRALPIIIKTINSRFDAIEENSAKRALARLEQDCPLAFRAMKKETISSKEACFLLGIEKTRLCQLAKEYPEIRNSKGYDHKKVIMLRDQRLAQKAKN